MKLSVVISVYQSYEIVRRQTLYWSKLNLPKDIEFIIVDDGSEPALRACDYNLTNLQIVYTNNKLAWTQGLGRNLGATVATGDILLMTDIDHIVTEMALLAARDLNHPKMIFRRQIGIITTDGELTQDRDLLRAWGYERDGYAASVHGNTWAMPREDFLALGGYAEETCNLGYHPKSRRGDDCYFNAKWNKTHRGILPTVGPDIYLFPTGRFHVTGELNPHGYFHNLHHREERSFKLPDNLDRVDRHL